MKYNCLIVDDEPLAQDVLESHLQQLPELHLLAKCNNAAQALEMVKNEQVDIMFLDIQMPGITGLEFLKSLKDPPAVIFTTAYAEHALEGFNLDAVDYLLKPISIERFLKAVNKATHQISLEREAGNHTATGGDEFIFVKSDKKIVKIILKDIMYIEGLKDYVMIFTPGKRIITLQTMKNLEERLEGEHFMRVHRSFIVSVDGIKAVSGNSVEISDKRIPIGKHYKDKLMALIEKYNLIK